jgi:hypothetical protein
MRRKAWVSVAAVLFGMIGLARGQEPTTMTAVAPLAIVTPTLDGVISAGEWTDANSYTFDGTDLLRPGWVNPTTAIRPASSWSCTFYVKHDASYVYVATVVTDNVIMNDSGATQWDDDNMELYFDPNNSNSNPKEGTATGGFQISYKSDDSVGGGQGYNNWWNARARIAAPGYTIEFRISKSLTGMVTGRKYGFDLSPDEDDDGTGRDCQIWWNSKVDTAWNIETTWGEITLSTQTLAPTTPPTAPGGLAATAISSSRVSLTWTDNSNNEQLFKIERSPNGTAFTEITTVNADVTSFVDMGLSADTQYWYRVRAYNAAGDSGYSNTANVRTPLPELGIIRWFRYR